MLRRRPTGQSQIVSRHARALAAGMAERDVQEPPSHQGVPHLGAGKKTVPAYTVYKPQRLEASSVRRGLCKFDGRCSPRRSGTPGSGGQPDQAPSLKPGPEVSTQEQAIHVRV